MGRTLTAAEYTGRRASARRAARLRAGAVQPSARRPCRRRSSALLGCRLGTPIGVVALAPFAAAGVAAQLGGEVARALGELLAGLAGQLGGALGDGPGLLAGNGGQLGGLGADLADDRRGLRGQVLDHGLELGQPLAGLARPGAAARSRARSRRSLVGRSAPSRGSRRSRLVVSSVMWVSSSCDAAPNCVRRRPGRSYVRSRHSAPGGAASRSSQQRFADPRRWLPDRRRPTTAAPAARRGADRIVAPEHDVEPPPIAAPGHERRGRPADLDVRAPLSARAREPFRHLAPGPSPPPPDPAARPSASRAARTAANRSAAGGRAPRRRTPRRRPVATATIAGCSGW